MPWDAQTFGRHNHALHGAEAAHAARIANAVLRSGAPEGLSIAVANKWAQRHANGGGINGDGMALRLDAGGAVDPSSIGGFAPSGQTQSPLTQGMIQRYSSYPTEKLSELAGMLGGTPQGQIVQRLLTQRRVMPNAQPLQQQAVPVPNPAATGTAYGQRRGGATPRRAAGGMTGVPLSMADPWWTRQEAYSAGRGGGFLAGTTAGRADDIKTTAPGGAYVLPADVVAGIGEGNSLAGARVIDSMVHSGPFGQRQEGMRRGAGPPRPPSMREATAFQAKGGGVHEGPAEETNVALSHGEYVLSPEQVMTLAQKLFPGRGLTLEQAHKILDEYVVLMRKHNIDHLKKLPGPVKAGE